MCMLCWICKPRLDSTKTTGVKFQRRLHSIEKLDMKNLKVSGLILSCIPYLIFEVFLSMQVVDSIQVFPPLDEKMKIQRGKKSGKRKI